MSLFNEILKYFELPLDEENAAENFSTTGKVESVKVPIVDWVGSIYFDAEGLHAIALDHYDKSRPILKWDKLKSFHVEIGDDGELVVDPTYEKKG